MSKKHVVAKADEIPVGTRKVVTVRGRPIVILNIKGEYFGLFNRCPHQGGPLSAGPLTGLVKSDMPGEYSMERQGEILRCPWHGWEFDVRTGQSYCDPHTVQARTFDVKAQPGCRIAEGPFVAETVKVDVDGDYVVVEM